QRHHDPPFLRGHRTDVPGSGERHRGEHHQPGRWGPDQESVDLTMTDRIRSAEVIVSSPGRNFVTLNILTEDGIVGWGDATVNGRELAVASYLRDHVAPLLIGRRSEEHTSELQSREN